MDALLRVSRGIDAVVETIGRSARWLIVLLVFVGFYNVVARYVGRFVGAQLTSNVLIETQWYIFSVLFFLGFAYILKHNVNVRVDILYNRWSPRRRALVDLLGHLLFLLPFCLLGIYATLNPVLLSWGRLPDGTWGTWEISPDPDGLPRAPIKSMILVAFTLLLLQTLSQIIKCIAVLAGRASEEYAPLDRTELPTSIEE